MHAHNPDDDQTFELDLDPAALLESVRALSGWIESPLPADPLVGAMVRIEAGGEVYRTRDTEAARQAVARIVEAKMLAPDDRARLAVELDSAVIQHPNRSSRRWITDAEAQSINDAADASSLPMVLRVLDAVVGNALMNGEGLTAGALREVIRGGAELGNYGGGMNSTIDSARDALVAERTLEMRTERASNGKPRPVWWPAGFDPATDAD